jgi:GT2 family glycosyltransferase
MIKTNQKNKNKKRIKIVNKKFTLVKKHVKLFIGYLVNHPVAIIKAFPFLLLKGSDRFFDKLHQIENKQKNIKKTKSSFYYRLLQIKHWLSKIFFSPIFFLKLIFSKFFVPIYFIVTLLFFLTFKLFYLIFSIFRRKFKTNKDKNIINGISFIIPTWNKKDMVVDCVKNLDFIASNESINIPKEIIVIDNGSIDGTFEELLKLKTETLLIPVRSNINLGFARGINLGASNAKYNYIYLMNNDMVPKPKLIAEIVNFAQNLLKKNKPFFGLSSQIFFYDPKKIREESGKNYYHPDFGYLYVAHCVNDHNLQTPSITGYPGGGSSLINKDLFLKLGGYDRDLYLPLYDEDLDLGFIAWKFGFPSYFVPSSQIIHHHRSSSKKLKSDPNYYMFKNWLTFILKNYDSLSLILSHILFYPVRMFKDQRFVDYAWENTKIMHKILYKKIMLSRYKKVYKDSELINFPKFEFDFDNK